MRESLRFTGKLMSATFSRVAGRWYVSLTVDTPQPAPLPRPKSHGVVGVDLGVSTLATLSTGEVVQGPKPLARFLSLLRLRNKAVSRKNKGSANRRKAAFRLAKLHVRIVNIRNDAIHKLTTDLVRRFHTICIEDLNVKGMMANHSLARHIGDMGFGELRRQLEYKTAMYGRRLVVADRYFPSSKLCSACGHKVEELPLQVRIWLCPNCGTIHHRDLNAARNLALYVFMKRPTASSAGSQACGEEGSGHLFAQVVTPDSVKQEPSTLEG
jgi:putative transposase